MRMETQKIAKAFAKGERAKAARTETDGQRVWLHGNLIAERKRDEAGVYYALTLSGWNTVTTRDRLNGIARTLGLDVSFFQRKGAAMMREKRDGAWVEAEIDPRDMFGFRPS